MASVEGKVSKVLVKNFDGKMFYSFFLEGVDGLFTNGPKPLTIDKGDYVEVSYNDDNKGRHSVINYSKKAPPAAAKPATSGSGSSWGGSDRDDSISWQSSRKDAVIAAQALVELGAVDLGKKVSAKKDIFLDLVDELTVRMHLTWKNRDEVIAEYEDTHAPETKAVDATDVQEWDD